MPLGFSLSLSISHTLTYTQSFPVPAKQASPLNHSYAARFKSAQAKDFDTTGRDSYNASQTLKGTQACKELGLDKLGITGPTTIYRNLTYDELREHEVKNGDGEVANCEYGDVISINTGKYTGRSPNDRFLVQYPGSETDKNIDWNDINMPCKPEAYEELNKKAVDYLNTKDTIYVLDAFCGASPGSRRKVRFVTEYAWHQHFVANSTYL